MHLREVLDFLYAMNMKYIIALYHFIINKMQLNIVTNQKLIYYGKQELLRKLKIEQLYDPPI